ncbi:MAG: hypothetical protein AVO35_09665 [Candidatus Aegiribacteria sp. MLS_C]|nr:MAG: hypothetical protein AVO35_09665 [Candidatus Aegiribacteria sp. MLS_C]
MDRKEHDRIISRIVAKCWIDEAYRKNFLADPASVLKAEGIAVPDGVEIRVLEDTKNLRSFVLPVKPDDLGEVEELEDRLAASSLPLAGNTIPM